MPCLFVRKQLRVDESAIGVNFIELPVEQLIGYEKSCSHEKDVTFARSYPCPYPH